MSTFSTYALSPEIPEVQSLDAATIRAACLTICELARDTADAGLIMAALGIGREE